MAKYRITAPDGKQYDIEGNGTQEEALAHFQSQYAQMQQAQPQQAPPQAQVPQPQQPQAPQQPSPLVAQNPGEYDPSSQQFQSKYGPSWVDSVKEGLKHAPSAIKSTLLGVLQGATFNTGDEMAAGAAMADQRDLPLSQQTINSPQEYQAQNQQVLDASRRQLSQSQQEHPYLTAEGNLVGGTALGSNLAKGGLTLAGRATSIPGAIGAGALEGAGYGAAYGAGAGTSPQDRLAQAGKGAAMGGATGAVTGGIAGYAASKGVKLPTTDELKNTSQAAYKAAENAGVVLTSEASTGLAAKVSDALQSENFNPRMHVKTNVALDALVEDAAKGDGLTLTKLDQARQLFRDAAKSESGDDRVSKVAIRALDNAIKNLKPDELQAGDKSKALAALSDARKTWSQYSKASTLDDAMEIADVRGAGQTIAGKENAVRNQFQKLYESFIKDKAEAAMWSPEERQAIKNVANGTNVGRALRILGKFRIRNTVTGLGAGAAYMAGGLPLAAATAGIGEAGYWGSLASRLNQAKLAEQLIKTGTQGFTMGTGASAANAGIAAALNQQLPAGGGVLSSEEQRKIAEKLRNARAAGP